MPPAAPYAAAAALSHHLPACLHFNDIVSRTLLCKGFLHRHLTPHWQTTALALCIVTLGV